MVHQKLIVTRGLPASGKTTAAKLLVDQFPNTYHRVNKDDIRAMLNNSHYEKGVTEQIVISARDAMIIALLKAGVSVIVDDTNLAQRNVRQLKKMADRAKVEFYVADFTDVSVDECIYRDEKRDNPVGEKVIRDMYQRYLKGKTYPLPLPTETYAAPATYVAPIDMPKAVIVDIDGTVALHNGRNPYNTDICDQDLPNQAVIDLVGMFFNLGHEVLFVSGRNDGSKEMTAAWIEKHMPFLGVEQPYSGYHLHMRVKGDERRDSVIKNEIFDEHIRDHYHVTHVLDDRNSVVEFWRSIGLTVLQVAPGDF